LDYLDAPLDESNINRFIKYCSGSFPTLNFIFINAQQAPRMAGRYSYWA